MIRPGGIRENPVFVKEMRVGFREKKVFYALTAWVLIVALFASISSAAALSETNSISQLPDAGKALFEMLFWVQLVLLAMLSPSLTTSAVSGERERQSFEMLLTTHLAPSELIFGKFGFAASFIILSLFSTVPLEAIVFFLGGVSLTSFLSAKLILLTFGLLCSLLGLMLSARETRSAYATGQTYLCLMILSFTVLPVFSVMRYAEDVPTVAYALTTLLSIYFMLFFFWKAVNHLEERAAHLKILLTIGLVFYVGLVGVSLTDKDIWGDLDDSIWFAYGPIQYMLMGILLNPIRPERARERALFAKSPLSNPRYWMLLLIFGTLIPNIHAEDAAFTVMSVYVVLAGLGTGLFARGLSVRNPARYPFALGFSWLLLNVLPAFTAITGISENDRVWHPMMISPFAFLVSGYDHHSSDPPLTAFAFYTVLIVVGLSMSVARKTAPSAPAVSPTKPPVSG
jgi:ABC-type transport system involved in multi-copper enzyme maturation permease subunit